MPSYFPLTALIFLLSTTYTLCRMCSHRIGIAQLTRYWDLAQSSGLVGTIPNPAIGPLRTPPAIQGSVIALRTAGKSKRSIAKELGIDRKTVDNVLDVFQADQPNYATTIRELTTKAFVRVANSIEN